jgi:hypothetical protein
MFRTDGVADNSVFLDVYRRIAPVDFLESFVFRGYRQDLQAVGFKIFPDHLEKLWFRRIWTWLQTEPDLKLIHIKRCNKLDVYLSLVRAQVSGNWSVDWPVKRTETGPVRLDPAKCRQAFERSERLDQLLEKKVPRANLISMEYDEVCENQDSHLRRLQEHLGLPVQPIAPGILKQRTRSLRESIANYDELYGAFRGTRWGHFFDGR